MDKFIDNIFYKTGISIFSDIGLRCITVIKSYILYFFRGKYSQFQSPCEKFFVTIQMVCIV